MEEEKNDNNDDKINTISNIKNDRSEKVTSLIKALVKFQGGLTPVAKNSTNPFFKNKYANLDAIKEHCRKGLSDNGLVVIQTTLPCEDNEKGQVKLLTTLYHESGEYIESILKMAPKNATPQDYGSTMTYARRYSYSAILGVCADDDDDGNQGSGTKKKGASDNQQGTTKPENGKATEQQCKLISVKLGQAVKEKAEAEDVECNQEYKNNYKKEVLDKLSSDLKLAEPISSLKEVPTSAVNALLAIIQGKGQSEG